MSLTEQVLGATLSIESVSKSFPGRAGHWVKAVEDITLQINPGEFVALLGPSGCGKSTLLSMIAGLETPDEGAVRLDNELINSPREQVGLMFQDPVLLPWKTAEQNVLLPHTAKHGRRRQKVESNGLTPQTALTRVGLEDFMQSYPWELSGGMQRRVSLARILFQNPGILLMDEPFSALDEFTRFSLNILLRQLLAESGKTVLLVTHNVEEAVLMANRVGILTPRPGRLQHIISVPLSNERDDSTMATPEFADAVLDIRRRLSDLQRPASQ